MTGVEVKSACFRIGVNNPTPTMPSIFDALSRDTTSAYNSLAAMIEKEQRSHFLSARSCNIYQDSDNDITPDDRMMMVDWAYSIVDTCKFDRMTVAMAMEMVDRFSSNNPGSVTQTYLSDHKQYQLLVVAALYIAIKVTEPVAFGSDLFAEVCNGMYSVEEIEDTELIILRGLGWLINAPSSTLMAYDLLSIIVPKIDLSGKTLSFLLDEIRFQTEYAVRDAYFSRQRPSTIAIAAIFNALDYLDQKSCKEILSALILVMDEQFDCLSQVFETKNRLRCLVERDDVLEEDAMPCPDLEDEDAFHGAQRSTSESTKTSPRTTIDCV